MRRGFYSAANLSARKPAREKPAAAQVAEPAKRAWRDRYKRHEKPILFLAGAALAIALVVMHAELTPAARPVTQDDIDQAVARTLEAKAVPSPAVKAYQAVRPSIVRVRAAGGNAGEGLEPGDVARRATGSGVVIIDRGVILTSLHVVAGAGGGGGRVGGGRGGGA